MQWGKTSPFFFTDSEVLHSIFFLFQCPLKSCTIFLHFWLMLIILPFCYIESASSISIHLSCSRQLICHAGILIAQTFWRTYHIKTNKNNILSQLLSNYFPSLLASLPSSSNLIFEGKDFKIMLRACRQALRRCCQHTNSILIELVSI